MVGGGVVYFHHWLVVLPTIIVELSTGPAEVGLLLAQIARILEGVHLYPGVSGRISDIDIDRGVTLLAVLAIQSESAAVQRVIGDVAEAGAFTQVVDFLVAPAEKAVGTQDQVTSGNFLEKGILILPGHVVEGT